MKKSVAFSLLVIITILTPFLQVGRHASDRPPGTHYVQTWDTNEFCSKQNPPNCGYRPASFPIRVNPTDTAGLTSYLSQVLQGSKSATSTQLSCGTDMLQVGIFIVCTATVTGNSPSGNVTFQSSSSTGIFLPPSNVCTLYLGECSVLYSNTAMLNDSDTITVAYGGDPFNMGSYTDQFLHVVKPSNTISVDVYVYPLRSGAAHFDETRTGVSVAIADSSDPDGTPVGVATRELTSPLGSVNVSLGAARYFDVQMRGITMGSATVCIIYNQLTDRAVIDYWNGTAWKTASSLALQVGPSICGVIPVSALTGTNVAVGNTAQKTSTIFGVSPAILYAIIGIVLVALAAVVVTGYLRVRKRTG